VLEWKEQVAFVCQFGFKCGSREGRQSFSGGGAIKSTINCKKNKQNCNELQHLPDQVKKMAYGFFAVKLFQNCMASQAYAPIAAEFATAKWNKILKLAPRNKML
jgi:hypothetical protein